MRLFGQSRNTLKKSKPSCNKLGRTRKSNRIACPEALEMRSMMASDIGASVDQGRLLIYGSNQQDSLLIVPGIVSGEFVVRGGVNKDGSTSTINGAAQQTFTGVTEQIYISLRDEADTLKIEEIKNVALSIHTGNGDDDISIGKYVPIPVTDPNEPISVPINNLGIMSGEGNDNIFIGRVFGNCNIGIQANGGDDRVEIYNATANSVAIITGEGDDQIHVGYLTTRDNLIIGGEEGNDLVNYYCSHGIDLVGISGGDGADTIAVDVNKFDEWLYIIADNEIEDGGDDTVLFARSIFFEVEIRLVAGNNTLYFGKYYDYDNESNLILKNAGSSGQYAHIYGSDIGNDHVEIAANILHYGLSASFGSGDDNVDISYNHIKQLYMYGEGGTNTLKKMHNVFETETYTDFVEV